MIIQGQLQMDNNFDQHPDVTLTMIDTLLSKYVKVYDEPTMTEEETNTERIVNLLKK